MIGNYPGCPSLDLGFSGKIDEVHVFNRALGADEIHRGYFYSQYLSSAFPDDLVL